MTGTTSGGQPLTHGALETPPIHIPNGRGGAYKTELVIERAPMSTTKILWWHEDDPRDEPHNHPWEFTSLILAGGYTDYHYWVDTDGVVQAGVETFRAGGENHVPVNVFHSVRDVLPGTRTRMMCGAAAPGNEWGYLDLATGGYITALDKRFETDPPFLDQLRALNPHMRPTVES